MSTPLSVDEVLDLQLVGDAQVDPGGTQVAYVVAAACMEPGEPNPSSRIWLTTLTDGAPRQISFGPGTEDQPRWSPDGSSLAFRSDRAERGKAQLYMLRQAIGDTQPLHTFPRSVSSYAWSPDGSQIAALVPEEGRKAEHGEDHRLFEDEPQYSRVWLIDIASGEARIVTEAPVQLWEIAWSPDGRSLAAIASDQSYRWSWYQPRLIRIDLESGALTTLYIPEKRQLARPAWSPDGAQIAVVTSIWSDPGMTGGEVLLVPADGDEARNVTGYGPRSHQSIHWRSDSQSFLSAAIERGQAAVCETNLDGGTETLWSGKRALMNPAISVSADGQIVAGAYSSPTEPSEVWAARLDGDEAWRRLSSHNDHLQGRAFGVTETLHWTAEDGLEIQGLLVRPNGLEDATNLPMLTMIHGGPTICWGYNFPCQGVAAWVPQALAQGWAVFLPNPRGSLGWGIEFAEGNQRDLGGGDLHDILAGVDYCVEQGIADPERLLVCGWSYGGYQTAWTVTQTDRFKAAIAGASITNWVSYQGTSDIPGFNETFYRDDPYSLDSLHVSRSPIFSVHQVTTPTLFVHGEVDLICPVAQPTEMFRALRRKGVQTECVIYPREGHPIRERVHRRDLLERGLNWFTQHLG